MNENKYFYYFITLFPCPLPSETYVKPVIAEQRSLQYLCQVFRGTRYWVGFGNKFCYRRHVDKTFPDEVQSSWEGTLNFDSSRHLWTKKNDIKKFSPWRSAHDKCIFYLLINCFYFSMSRGQSRTSLVVQWLGIHLPMQETHI